MGINWFTHCLFSNEMNLRNPQATDRGTQFNAAHAQLLDKLRPIALAEICQFLTIQSLEFQEKSEFWHGEFLMLQKTIYSELRKSPMSKFY